MGDFVRTRDPISGAEETHPRPFAEAAGLQILDGRPAVDSFGRPLPSKPRVNKGGASGAVVNPKEK